MNETIDFENISEEFQRSFETDSVSHCDLLQVTDDSVFFIEKTKYVNKNLLDKNIYQNEIAEIVKKMWGSLVIFLWYSTECRKEKSLLKKEKNFILQVKVNKRLTKVLSKLIRDMKKYKDGAYCDVKLNIEEEVEK